MTDRKQEHKPEKKVKIDKLQLSRETVKELTDLQTERVKAGAAPRNTRDLQCSAI